MRLCSGPFHQAAQMISSNTQGQAEIDDEVPPVPSNSPRMQTTFRKIWDQWEASVHCRSRFYGGRGRRCSGIRVSHWDPPKQGVFPSHTAQNAIFRFFSILLTLTSPVVPEGLPELDDQTYRALSLSVPLFPPSKKGGDYHSSLVRS